MVMFGVRGRHDLLVGHAEQFEGVRDQVDRDQIHQVHQEHPDEDRQGQRRDQRVAPVEGVPHGVVDEADDHFDGIDQAAGNTGAGFFGDAIGTASRKRCRGRWTRSWNQRGSH
jgi:hypothetical protein